jgi:hypothetical protein
VSIDATRHAWQRQGLRPAEKLVLLAMADRAGEDHCCWPSVDRLVLDTGLDRKTVGRAVAALLAVGEIEDTGRRAGASRRVRIYRMTGVCGREDGKIPPKTGLSQKRDDPQNGMIPKTGPSQNGDDPKNGPIDRPKNGPIDRPKNGPIPLIGNEPTNEPTNEPPTCCASGDAPPAQTGGTPPAGEEKFLLTKRKRKLSGLRLAWFEVFWTAFDYKHGKTAAADAWLDIPSLKNAVCQQIVMAAKREAEARPALVAAGQTPKWAQGWISERRWEDEHGPATPAPRAGQGGQGGAARQDDAYSALVDRARQRQQQAGQGNQENGRPEDRQGGAA